MRIRPPLADVPKSIVGQSDRMASAASARAANLAKFATRVSPNHAMLAERAAAQAVREAQRRADRDTEVARVNAEYADRKAAGLADTEARRIEAEQFAADQAMLSAQAQADLIALTAYRQRLRDERYAKRSAKAKRSR